MTKISPQSKSFIILFVIALIGGYICILLWSDLVSKGNAYTNNTSAAVVSPSPAPSPAVPVNPTVDTSLWKTYTNSNFQLSFKYKPDWKVLAPKKVKDWTILEIDPGKKFYNIKIYISPNDYYAMGGLETKNVTIGGQPAIDVSDLLYGVKANGWYYTFDINLSLSLKDNFNALVNSVQFSK